MRLRTCFNKKQDLHTPSGEHRPRRLSHLVAVLHSWEGSWDLRGVNKTASQRRCRANTPTHPSARSMCVCVRVFGCHGEERRKRHLEARLAIHHSTSLSRSGGGGAARDEMAWKGRTVHQPASLDAWIRLAEPSSAPPFSNTV